MKKIICFKTSCGWINIVENNSSIDSISFGRLKQKGSSKQLIDLKKQIQNHFFNKFYKWNFKLTIVGTILQKKIPFGKTVTYGYIAKKIKTSPRYVGSVCSQNLHLLVIPCHRVIRSDGAFGGFSGLGGILLKRKLLYMESL